MELTKLPILDQVHNPEYTGENRCIPCTVVNLVIAGALTVAVAIASPIAAVAVFVLSVVAIGLRGYLVPGTPTLTKQYFPDWLLAKFDKAPEPGGSTLETDAAETGADARSHAAGEPIEPEQWFLEHELVVPCTRAADDSEQEQEDLCLADDLETTWQEAIDEIQNGERASQVAAFLETEPASVSIDQPDDATSPVRARVEDRVAAQWESDAALVADLASSRALATQVPEWDQLSLEQRSQLANGLRAFVEQCPGCNGTISLDEETVESCCRSYQVYAITCNECDARILEVRQ
ncbi:hypothetical protein [Natrialba asiatica]|uniref:Uncharacterized protein n=1 Tax=Natrialba asiatica (strain ATCC 700177 / DSM 12278 / JCM 9576 / FERM P-10747 / NBRC 102637 / 172P1) TaxID=29540 RepID=M0AHK7_NATA1|nr:hypothetical protein [Natrialba asiatica]ELY97861.1 hypothetical protein C481_18035 [Natrialba asiatica DSM 12278]